METECIIIKDRLNKNEENPYRENGMDFFIALIRIIFIYNVKT